MRTPILASVALLLFLAAPMGVLGQPVFRGKVLDARVDLPLVGAHIKSIKGDALGVTDDNGNFELRLSSRNPVVRISYVGFQDLEARWDRSLPAGERALFRMLPAPVELPVFEVKVAAPEVVFERTDLHVGDFLVGNEGLWVLAYDRPRIWRPAPPDASPGSSSYWARAAPPVMRGARLHLLDPELNELASTSLPGEAVTLHRDYAGRAIAEGPTGAWLATTPVDSIELGEIEPTVLLEDVLPWTDSIHGRLLGNNKDPTFPAFDHFARDLITSEDLVFCSVVDELTLSLFRSQYKYMSNSDKVIAMNMGRDLGVDAEIVAGYMTGYSDDKHFRAPYAPLFIVNDTLCVFDHCKERIRRYDRDENPIDEIPIVYQRDGQWQGDVMLDPTTSSVCARFAKGPLTWLQRIDPASGQLGAIERLTYPWPEDVQVYGGYAYYVYRTYGSLQKRTLYREALR